MPLFADVVEQNDALVRKALNTIVAVAPYTTPALTTILSPTTTALAALPAGWVQLGRLTEDGSTWPRETEMSEIFGQGSANPVRSDIRRAVKRVSFTLLEARRKTIELAQGIDLSGVVPAATTGEVKWDEPDLPTYPYMRMVAIAQDVTGTGEMYIGRHLLRCKVTEAGEDMWSDQDQAMVTPLTFTAYNDETAGTPMRHFRGGPGYAEVVTNEGFVA
jgi:hypothetical protein